MPHEKKDRIFDRCVYKNCSNGRYSTGSRLYRFPSSTDPRCEVWTQYTGNPLLKKWSPSTLRHAGLCASHFPPSCLEENGNLKRKSIPIEYHQVFHRDVSQDKQQQISYIESAECDSVNCKESVIENVEPPSIDKDPCTLRTYSISSLNFSEDDESMEWTSIEPEQVLGEKNNSLEAQQEFQDNRKSNAVLKRKVAFYRRRSKDLMRKLIRMSDRMRKLQHETKKETVDEFLDRNDCVDPVARTMVELQLHKGNTRYSEDQKDLSKQMFFYSAAAYIRLRNAGCNLPAESTVRSWIAEVDVRPGFCSDIFEKLKIKLSTLPPEERQCCLKWDEMSIRCFEEYSEKFDCVEGLVDLGSLGRRNERARYVFIFCIDSLNAHNAWRQPIAFFFSAKGMKTNEIYELLEECLRKLNEAGAEVKLLTCDQGPCNQSLYSSLLGVNEEVSICEIGDRKYFASFDFPHLIKRLLSTLRKYNVLYCGNEVIAVYQDFVDTWLYDVKSSTSRLLSHITEVHLFPNSFETMNVKRAFQIFSHRYAAAIMTAGNDPHGLRSSTWEATAAFAERMNTVIDACNAYRLRNYNPAKRPLADRNPNIGKILADFMNWSSKWSVAVDRMHPTTTMKRVPCLRGLPLTVKAILHTYEDIKVNHPDFELAAALCNQDSVEHLFSKLRQRGGFNPNPTARGVRLTLRHILSTGYIGTSNRGNVQSLDGVALLNPASIITQAFEKCNNTEIILAGDEEALDVLEIETASDTIDSYNENTNDASDSTACTYERNAIAFFAGYIAHRNLAKNPCDLCRDEVLKCPMDDASPDEMYIEYREYENVDIDAPTVTKLKRPTYKFTAIVKTQLEAYSHLFKKYWHCEGLLRKLSSTIEKITETHYPAWFDDAHPCKNHRLQFLKFLIKVKLFAQTRYHNGAARKSRFINANPKHALKLKKFQNT